MDRIAPAGVAEADRAPPIPLKWRNVRDILPDLGVGSLILSLEATRHEPAARAAPEHTLTLHATHRW